ncbi:multidrug effflux MFS transporter [Alloscardovia macacae]|uniref:multidrug effflux MFS transporter n=1 Tax=Alloscardovia macacae TaxID=1160091 RepID=UPI001FCF24FF|nr:multidrug effflux MFS transporter [Alloscardovia macacae]
MTTEEHKKPTLAFILILSAFMAFTSLATDVYLPAMPDMQHDLGGHAEMTITGFVGGFALAQLVWGPISDKIGRKTPLFIGTLLFIAGAVGCALAPSMHAAIFWRMIQAFGACTGPMISRAMVRDLYDGTNAARVLTTLMLIMAAAPLVGPLIGGGLLAVGPVFGLEPRAAWRLSFWFMAVAGTILFFFIFALPETLHRGEPGSQCENPSSLRKNFAAYATLLKNHAFMIYTLSVTFFYLGVYAYISASSTIYIDHFHVPAEVYSVLFGVNILGVMIMSTANRQLVLRFALKDLLAVATAVAFGFSVVLMIVGLTHVGGQSVWGLAAIVVSMFFVFSMNGIVAACSNAAALNCVPESMAGSAAALLGALQYGSGVVPSLILSVFADPTAGVMSVIICVSMLCAATMGQLGRRI